ncbi:MAG: DUF2892 domain-containing protein [Candidatus Scalindua sp.]|nr:DUF2892 domain-containing protein [Candidatus Scalindua sp.]
MKFVVDNRKTENIVTLQIVPFAHPQGCIGYLMADRASKEALALDVHLDFVYDMSERVKLEGWKLRYVVDSHTHADHPSGAASFAKKFDCIRVTHEQSNHIGVTFHPKDGEQINLGESKITVRHTPGHTQDHIVLITDGALFSGDSLLIGSVARTDFLGGNASQLFDSIHLLQADLPDQTTLFPGHDYRGRIKSTLEEEKKCNPWLLITDRDEFVRNLTANPPPKPANMNDLLRLNRQGVNIEENISVPEVINLVRAGGAASVIDVRTEAEFESEHIEGSHLLPLDKIEEKSDEVRAVPAPRLLLCQSGNRASMAKSRLEKLNVAGLSVIKGGIVSYKEAGGETLRGKLRISLERQVRIASGSLVLLGLVTGFYIHPAFLILSGFAGGGLIFAGITDYCGLGILLSKMPWNRYSSKSNISPVSHSCEASQPGTYAASLTDKKASKR